MFDHDLTALAAETIAEARRQGVRLATAESCTGGLVAALLTEVPGASDAFGCGVVTYANAAKSALLGVPSRLIEAVGAVSEPVARAMAEGALEACQADVAVAITGIAGPSGGTADKPVGLVHIACARRGGDIRHQAHRFGDIGRSAVRRASAEAALRLLRGGIA